MQNLIIIGAGGMGRTFFDIARECAGYNADYTIKGFIDDNINALDGFSNYPPIIGTISDYIPQHGDVFTCSIGGTAKKMCSIRIIEQGGTFINLIHKTARIGSNVCIGAGNIIGAFVSIGADAHIGSYNLIQSYSVIAHDARIGDWNRIDTHVVCVGGTVVMNDVSIHTSAVINHKVVIEDGAKVGAGSFVIRKVKAGTTVFGNPAKILVD